MRDYELIYIVHPELDETAVKELTTKIQGWITDAGGSISKLDFWGKRRLAYPIRKQIEGQYVFIRANDGSQLWQLRSNETCASPNLLSAFCLPLWTE